MYKIKSEKKAMVSYMLKLNSTENFFFIKINGFDKPIN